VTLWMWSGLAGFIAGALFAFIPMEKQYLSYKATVEAVGQQQEQVTKLIAAQHKQAKEDIDAHWKAINDRDTARISTLRVQLANERNARLVPSSPTGTPGSDRVCYSGDELDRSLRASLNRLSERIAGIAETGQAAVNVATSCREWVGRIRQP
jgi:hypothetical protein